MKFVCSGFGDDIDHRSASAAELGRESILIDLKLLYGFFRELIRRAHAAAPKRLAKESVVVVDAVNLKTVEGTALTTDGKIATARIANHTRRQRRKVLKVTPIDRQVID